MTYYISAKRFYFEHKIKEGGYLAVEDSRFGDWTENVPEGAEVLDYSDYQISPGDCWRRCRRERQRRL